MTLVVCPSPVCPGRSVQGDEVIRESWEATRHELNRRAFDYEPGDGYWDADIHCPRCSTEGIDPESGQLDSAEEELGERCSNCGIVSAKDAHGTYPKPRLCAYCGEPTL